VSTSPRAPLPAAYWRLWTASAVSNLGDGIFLVALPLLAARLTRSEIQISIVAAAASLPWLLLSLPIGTLIDRSDRRRVLIVADTVRVGLIAVLAVAAATERAEIWMLWIVALGLGIAEVFFDNASQAIVPAIVPADLLAKANGRRYAAEMAANTFIGTPIGSLLFATAVWLPFGIDAATFAFSVVMVLGVRGSFRAVDRATLPDLRTSLVGETRDGMRWLWRHPLLRSLALALGLSNLGFQVAQAVFVLFAQDRLGIGERAFGLLLGVMGVGAVVGALLGERLALWLGRAGAIYLALGTWVVTLALTGAIPVTWFVALMAAIESAAATAWSVVTVSLRQEIVPAELFGRVNSVYRWFGWGTLPVGSLIGGQVANVFGLRAPYFVGAGFALAAVLVSLPHVTGRSIAAALDDAAADRQAVDRTPAPPSMT
jgi:MFS family permease